MADFNFRDHRNYLLHLLLVLAKRGPSRPSDIYDEVADLAGVTPEQRLARGQRGTDNPVYKNRIQFARQSLVDTGALIGPDDSRWQRGVWELSQEGLRLAKIKPLTVLEERLQASAAEGARRRAEEREESRKLAGLDSAETPEEEDSAPPSAIAAEAPTTAPTEVDLQHLVDAANEVVMSTMLEHIRTMSDRAFEYLVGSVLKTALNAESVKITQKARDGGLDGILTFDSLGMRVAVFEAKRYAEGNTVGRPLIDAFATAARRHRAAHALFVTSSKFSAEAKEAARDEAIRLVDGTALVELMAKHGFGLRERERFVLYEVDPAWSVDEDPSEPAH